MAGLLPQKHLYLVWGQRKQDDITRLSREWEARVAEDGRVFFVNHEEKRTQWEYPITKHRYKVPPGLPYGWQKFKDDEDVLVFADHINQLCTPVHPRLITNAVYDFPTLYGIKSYPSLKKGFPPLVKASEVLKEVDLGHKVAIVTGANSGLGFQTALSLAKRGAHVILACRNSLRAEEAVRRIRAKEDDAKVEAMQLDLASLWSVKTFANEFIRKGLPLHILICNAGVFGGPFTLTEDGLEHHFAVNHLGHFYLCKLLLEVLRTSKPSRIVVLSSESHWFPSYSSSQLQLQALQHPSRDSYSAITSYGASKLCNLLFMLEFHQRYSDAGISCTAVHPGNLLPTNLVKNAGCLYRVGFTLARPFTSSVEQATATIVYCAAHPNLENISGLYMYECFPALPSSEAQDCGTAVALWELSEQIIADKTAAFSET